MCAHFLLTGSTQAGLEAHLRKKERKTCSKKKNAEFSFLLGQMRSDYSNGWPTVELELEGIDEGNKRCTEQTE